MNRFVIVDGLPYLFANGKTSAVRWDEKGFTVGMEVEMASIPSSPITYSELSIKAKCAGRLNSIDVPEPAQDAQGEPKQPDDIQNNQEAQTQPEEAQNGQEEPEEILDDEEEPVLDEMTIAELKEYAAKHDIDLGDAKKKADILAVLKGREDA
jgi:hypothetical protein